MSERIKGEGMAIPKKEKFTNIETLRGMVVLLVVLGHVIGSSPDGGMQIPHSSPIRYIYVWINFIQMPLFTAIAGWVYALKPVYDKNLVPLFVKKKAVRLLVPMASVATIYFLLQYFIPGTNQKGDLSDIWRIYVFPYTLYWYLPSLFLMFLIQLGYDLQWGKERSVNKWLIFLIIAFILRTISVENLFYDEDALLRRSIPNLFSFKGALTQLPFFILGVGIRRFKNELYTKKLNILYIIIAIAGVVSLQLRYFHLADPRLCDAFKPIGVSGCLFLLLNQHYSNAFLTWLGKYAYTIYLFHGFATSGVRIGLEQLKIAFPAVIFPVSTAAAIGVPVIIEWLSDRFKLTKLLFLGKYSFAEDKRRKKVE